MKIKEIVTGDAQAFFGRYRQGHFYYTVRVAEKMYEFPVPLDDIGDATLKGQEKAITLMRYIRKALEAGSFVRC